MEIKTINYKRVHNLGNYNSEHLEMFAELAPDDDVEQCTDALKTYVEIGLGIIGTELPSEPKPAPANYDSELF